MKPSFLLSLLLLCCLCCCREDVEEEESVWCWCLDGEWMTGGTTEVESRSGTESRCRESDDDEPPRAERGDGSGVVASISLKAETLNKSFVKIIYKYC